METARIFDEIPQDVKCRFGQQQMFLDDSVRCRCALCCQPLRKYLWRVAGSDVHGVLEARSIREVRLKLDLGCDTGTVVEVVPLSRVVNYVTQ